MINLGSSAPVTNSCFLPLSSCFFFVLPENLLRCCSDLLHHCDQPGNKSVEVTYSNSGASQSLGNKSVSPCPSLPSFSAVVLRVAFGPAASVSPGNLLGMQTLGPHPRPFQWETGNGARSLVLTSPPKDATASSHLRTAALVG